MRAWDCLAGVVEARLAARVLDGGVEPWRRPATKTGEEKASAVGVEPYLPSRPGGKMTIPSAITVYGAYWCPDCHRSKQFLGEHQIPYEWVDVEEDAEGERYVIAANDGKRRIPTIVFGDGSFLANPTNSALAAKLGLKTTATRRHYDLVIVGGGPAGLTAALYTAREGIDTLVIERAALGGQAAATMHLDNVPGFPEGISGAELSARLRSQVERFGVELLRAQDVTGIRRQDNYSCVRTADGSEYSGLAVLLALGSRYRRLGVPGEEEYVGAGIHFCATCDGPFYRGRPVAVVGGGNSAAEESLFLTRFVERVTLLVRGQALNASQVIAEKVLRHSQIEVRFETVVESFEGAESKLRTVNVLDTRKGAHEALSLPAAFVFIGLDPNTGMLRDTPVRLDAWGFIVTGHSLVHDGARPGGFRDRDPAILETSLPGVFAAGDARAQSTKQVASAAGEGAAAALMIRDYLKTV
jgi:thioredoxin reductase (NADPH)